MRPSRRQWLAGVAGASTLALTGHAAARGESVDRPPKLSIAAYSYRKYLPEKDRAGEMSLFDLCDLAAEWGLDAVEPTSYYFTDESPAFMHRLKAHAFRLGLDMSGTAVRNNFSHPDPDVRKQDVAHVSRWVDHAVELGAPCIRVFAGNPHDDVTENAAVDLVIGEMKRACDYAGSRGVFLALENHGYLTGTAAEVMRIVNGVDHEWLGVNLDSGNFTVAPYENMAALAPYSVNVQLKVDVTTQDGSGKEEADYARIFKILEDAGYRGYVALEYEGREDPKTGVPKFLDRVRNAVSVS